MQYYIVTTKCILNAESISHMKNDIISVNWSHCFYIYNEPQIKILLVSVYQFTCNVLTYFCLN